MKNKHLKYFAATIAIAAFGGIAYANPIATITVSDNNGHSATTSSAGDITGWVVSVGNWTINVETGLITGNSTQPVLDLNSINADFTGGNVGNVLTINFTYGSFAALTGGFLNDVGGTENGISDQFNVLINGSAVTTQSFAFTPFSGSILGSAATATSIGIKAILTAGASGGETSFDDHLSVPDGGTTVAMLGLAFAGVAGLRRKLVKQ